MEGAAVVLVSFPEPFDKNCCNVCGRVTQFISCIHVFIQVPQSIEGNYVDGVLVTHRSPGSRQHIWTYATGIMENSPSSYPLYSSPCADRATALSIVPSFVGRLVSCMIIHTADVL